MKTNKKWFILIEAVLAVSVVLCIFLMMREGNTKITKQVSVIVENSADDRWTAFKYGVQMAAEEKQVRVSFVSTEGMLTAGITEALIRQEISDGADALIVQTLDDDTLQMIEEYSKKLPIMLVESAFLEDEREYTLPYTSPDNYEMGRELAVQIIKSYKGNIRGKRLGICQADADLVSSKERIRGLEDGLRGSGIVISWTLPDASGEKALQEQSKVDIVAAIDDKTLVAAGKCVENNDLHGAVVYGIGTSEGALYDLGVGLTECLVVPDEFDEGYQSLAEIEQRIANPFKRMQSYTTSYFVVDKKTLFAEENEKLLRIFSQ